ncbi:carboxymuconolactone decarboxylase family protein [Amycolatopsis cynarae]|uniref:Carboxymuconolactone decarboxylase family protein n=1 Tax=Amycolatopsis cynarae TaxID=2995223 RepID=A0ABY7ATH1_9PSEU|nr:carboxymuconolactone decarboxylase family protein [Amycolatopsis sp. HUAS 11-8]WAL63257.1 carboxymuconolactone decarboxylase family protein [Amycolatopsis sp. HUAS 11-8]
MDTEARREHVFLDKQNPEAYEALFQVAKTVRATAQEAGLDRRLIELINLRVSQINACSYCLDLHTRAALKAGETAQRLSVLPAWREAGLFSPREQAALAVAEAVTGLPAPHLREQEFARAREHLTDEEFGAVSWVALTIGTFNRLSIVSGHRPRPS